MNPVWFKYLPTFLRSRLEGRTYLLGSGCSRKVNCFGDGVVSRSLKGGLHANVPLWRHLMGGYEKAPQVRWNLLDGGD